MRRRIVCSCILTAIDRFTANSWTLHNRVPHGTFERLERHGGKLARAVLRGLGGSNPARLPGASCGERFPLRNACVVFPLCLCIGKQHATSTLSCFTKYGQESMIS